MANRTDRIAIFQAAGFTVLGEAADASGVTPSAAIRAVASTAVVPRVRIGLTDDGSLVATERAWWETARDVGLFDEHGTCYFCITGPGASTLPWLRARAPERSGFLPVLWEKTGSPDFVAVSTLGTPVVGVSEEEDENWIVVT
ncbi:hypothetical protein [Saccharomonospora cyanea]|uniref:Uncharacterized protein n=1 Tax=Saccharomonospora cyanea NA-134 TaxID=882082 RepID=H5XMJ6_9PSEU|nr:hypothetical protein [Saccharomonospora cyanea]EHR59946.1 hypothetical protein SaccyDRAFT_1033 [Saccharomonospora cyanea NA-134]